ncbi:hypothetical protein SISSUDRAFT_1066166 [Sistotremastrum suecicum HHB10207 ss-3]|uniref:Uncharacterized protein n=1 Tax=Sistotremastrum suecicum HHB10207 ss-3 TaxID=1314776 RepID=A0A165YMR3_9AGAM|nr:hypothetical protein SISSUDRAFT_1066166 [Sistotremastrum suecicum HHB10207 ss-3]
MSYVPSLFLLPPLRRGCDIVYGWIQGLYAWQWIFVPIKSSYASSSSSSSFVIILHHSHPAESFIDLLFPRLAPSFLRLFVAFDLPSHPSSITFLSFDLTPRLWILEGITTVTAGLLGSLVLYAFRSTATYLTDSERAYLVWRQKYAYSEAGEDVHISWIIWHRILHARTVGKTFGFNTPDKQLMTVSLYVCAALVLLTNSYFSDCTTLKFLYLE